MANSTNGEIAGQMLRSLAEAQIELNALRRELEESHRLVLVGTMAAGLAHEINNLLTPVLAHAQLSSSRPGDLELQARTLKKVMRGVKDAAVLTRTILGLAGNRPDDPAGPHQPRAAVRATVQSAFRCLVRDPKKDGIEIANRIPPDLEVRMEPILLQQVILNLILNAQRAMARRGGSITFEAQPLEDNTVEIEVSDTGPGIPEPMIGRLFEPFARRRSKRRREENRESRDSHPISSQESSDSQPTLGQDRNRKDPDVARNRRNRDSHQFTTGTKDAATSASTDVTISSTPIRKSESHQSSAAASRASTTAPINRATTSSPQQPDPTTRTRPAALDTTTDPGGAGLGLATCRLLIEHAGGRIAVRSAPNHGATFTLTLPRA